MMFIVDFFSAAIKNLRAETIAVLVCFGILAWLFHNDNLTLHEDLVRLDVHFENLQLQMAEHLK